MEVWEAESLMAQDTASQTPACRRGGIFWSSLLVLGAFIVIALTSFQGPVTPPSRGAAGSVWQKYEDSLTQGDTDDSSTTFAPELKHSHSPDDCNVCGDPAESFPTPCVDARRQKEDGTP